MSNAPAAYYEYLALVELDKARVFRAFGYHASAAVIEQRARGYQRRAKQATNGGPRGADDVVESGLVPLYSLGNEG